MIQERPRLAIGRQFAELPGLDTEHGKHERVVFFAPHIEKA